MGACSDPRADRTRFIINEDFKLKMEMIQSIQNFNKKKNGEDIGVYRSKNNESNQINKHDIPNVNIPANGNVIRKNTRDLTEEYEIEGQLGEGGYGKVYLVRHKRMNLLRAMKVISIDSKTSEERTDEEIELLKKLDHPNIIKLFEYFIDEDNYYLITEYCNGGDLFDLKKKKNKNFLN